MKICGIYKIQSKLKPERLYIGSTVSIKGRWRVHLHTLRNNKHHSKKLQNHYNKYGESDLVFIIIEPCLSEFLIIREQYYLDILKSYFNNCKIAGSPLGVKHSKEDNKKNSERLKGRKFSDETRKRISEAKKGQGLGRKQSIETCRKKAESHKGLRHSEETRKKIGDANKKRIISEETRDKMRENGSRFKGIKLSEEHKRKIGESKIGKKRKLFSIAWRKKMSDSHKKISA